MRTLVLDRRRGERIVIGDPIIAVIEVIRIGSKTKLAITAPDWVSVDREEIRERKGGCRLKK